MLYRIIDADDLPSLIRAFMDSYELVAPVKHDPGYIFDVIDDPSDVVLDYPTTIASPKKYFLPSEETLFKFDVASNDVVDFEIDIKPRVLFGVHPCDLNAIERLDAVFLDSRYGDPVSSCPSRSDIDRRRWLHAYAELLLPPSGR